MLVTSALVLQECAECRSVCSFEAPPCSDDHADCPELVCTECGSAVLLGAPWDDSAVTAAEPSPWLLPRSA